MWADTIVSLAPIACVTQLLTTDSCIGMTHGYTLTISWIVLHFLTLFFICWAGRSCSPGAMGVSATAEATTIDITSPEGHLLPASG